jgi:hypothetical protein
VFAGHVGAALALGRAERRVNVGALVFAALLLDFLLWLFILLGWESATIPADYARTHQVAFVFPYSHGLVAAIAWSAFAGAFMFVLHRGSIDARRRIGLFVAAAVFSHWFLDALVHIPEMPLFGSGPTKVGLGLWQNMPLALGVEGLGLLAGLWLFVSGRRLSRAGTVGLGVLSILLLAVTVIGTTTAPAPPSVDAMALSSLVTVVVVSMLVGWFARPSRGELRGSPTWLN